MLFRSPLQEEASSPPTLQEEASSPPTLQEEASSLLTPLQEENNPLSPSLENTEAEEMKIFTKTQLGVFGVNGMTSPGCVCV